MSKRLIYQVCLGKAKNSKLYRSCIESVQKYCTKHNIEHVVQTTPELRIKPDIFNTNRSVDSYQKHGGFLPIFEKEAAFKYLDSYDQIAIIDADIFIREDAPDIFEHIDNEAAIAAVVEREMPITDAYKQKISNYSTMQYHALHMQLEKIDFRPNELGYEFANMGMIVLNSKKFKPYLQGQTPKEFIERYEFKKFVDGIGNWKWSTDQTLLNYFIKKYNVPFQHLHWQWNGLYTANTKIDKCHFVHFFLKDKLPESGENVEKLLEQINEL